MTLKLPKLPSLVSQTRIVRISDRTKHPKSELNRWDFSHRPITERFDNRTIMLCPKSEHIRILALYCNFIMALLFSRKNK